MTSCGTPRCLLVPSARSPKGWRPKDPLRGGTASVPISRLRMLQIWGKKKKIDSLKPRSCWMEVGPPTPVPPSSPHSASPGTPQFFGVTDSQAATIQPGPRRPERPRSEVFLLPQIPCPFSKVNPQDLGTTRRLTVCDWQTRVSLSRWITPPPVQPRDDAVSRRLISTPLRPR